MRFNHIRKTVRRIRPVLVAQLLGTVVSALCAGCATPGYMGDRVRDAGDIFSLGVGAGLGAKVRVGPVATGLLVDAPLLAVRGGSVAMNSMNHDVPMPNSFDFQGLFIGAESFTGTPPARGKNFYAECSDHPFIPFLQTPDLIVGKRWESEPKYFYWQIEAVIGIGASIRTGFNPGELLDFILGWGGIDIFEDDLTEEVKESNKMPGPPP